MTDNSPVTLPPEILNSILEHAPTSGEGHKTLVACAFNGGYLVGRIQPKCNPDNHNYYLFSCNLIDYDNEPFRNTTNRRPFCCSSALQCWRYTPPSTKAPPPFSVDPRGQLQKMDKRCCPKAHLECVRSLTYRHSLILFDIRAEDTGGGFRACFSPFRESLTHLSLDSFTTAPGASLILVDYFPDFK